MFPGSCLYSCHIFSMRAFHPLQRTCYVPSLLQNRVLCLSLLGSMLSMTQVGKRNCCCIFQDSEALLAYTRNRSDIHRQTLVRTLERSRTYHSCAQLPWSWLLLPWLWQQPHAWRPYCGLLFVVPPKRLVDLILAIALARAAGH